MSYRDDAQAMQERLRALEARAGEADRLARRVAELERENAELRRALDRAAPHEPSPAPARPAPSLPREVLARLRALEASERWMDYCELLEQQIERSSDAASTAALYFLLAEVRADQLADRAEAIKLCHRSIETHPTAQAHALLEKLADDD